MSVSQLVVFSNVGFSEVSKHKSQLSPQMQISPVFADSSSERITESTFGSYYQHLKLTFIMFVMCLLCVKHRNLGKYGQKENKITHNSEHNLCLPFCGKYFQIFLHNVII